MSRISSIGRRFSSGIFIKLDEFLRNQFRGVRYGRLYQPTFALVDNGDKQVIVKINNIGPLRPGRVLNLNERSMRHDLSMTRGLLDDVRITLLPRENWTPGPVSSTYAINSAPGRAVASQQKPAN